MSGGYHVIDVAAMSHPGRTRPHNEDYLVVEAFHSAEPMFLPETRRFHLSRPLLFAIADGVGGSNAGEQASRMAIEYVAGAVERMAEGDIAEVLNEASRSIGEAAEANPDFAGMATTVVGLALRPGALSWFNVGDSRLYRYRDGFLAQVSVDDVPLAEKQAAKDSGRSTSVVSAVLGGMPPLPVLEPHGAVEKLPANGCWLLCSDGLSDMLDLELMEQFMKLDPREAVLQLYNAAMVAGGHDNISIIIVRATTAQAQP